MKRKRVPRGGGAATVKLREPKHVRTRGTANKLQSDELKSMRRSVLFQYRVKIGRLSTRDSFLSVCGAEVMIHSHCFICIHLLCSFYSKLNDDDDDDDCVSSLGSRDECRTAPDGCRPLDQADGLQP